MTKNICNTCLESDCSCVCSICGNHETITPVFKQTRSKKKLQIEWISCNSYSKWVHPICSELTSKEIQKIKNLSSKSKFDIFYKCLKCSLKTAKFARIIHKNFIEQDTSTTQTSLNNITKIDVSVDTQDLPKKEDTVKISLQSAGKVLETEKTLSKVQDPIKKESTNNSANCNASTAQNAVDFICIVENITKNNFRPRNSVTIKRQISKISSKKINIKHTYTLPRGGVAFHFKAQEDVNKFEKEVDNIYPGSTCSKPKSQGQYKKLIIKNINPFISTEQLHLSLRQTIDKPLPVICVACEVSICNNLLNKGIDLLGSHFDCENYIKPVVRCFNCQKFGHISMNYFNKHCCEYCGKNHPFQQPCSQESFCVNCNIPGHPSTSGECPKYIKKDLISHEVSPSQHYFL